MEKERAINDKMFWGLPGEYEGSVLFASKQTMMRDPDFPPGRLIFNVAGHAYIGSSKLIFEKVTKSILQLLEKRINGSELEEMERLFEKEVDANFCLK